MTTTGQQGSPLRFPSPQPPPFRPRLSTSWVPLDETIQVWASFGARATSAPALSATGIAFLALSWETSALHHRTWAYQDRQRGRSRSAARDLGQSMQDLSLAIRHWSQAFDEHHPVEDLEPVRALLSQVLSQQQRIWMLMQEVQEDLLAYGQHGAQGPGHLRDCSPGEDREEDCR
jgi:hypothetical protein